MTNLFTTLPADQLLAYCQSLPMHFLFSTTDAVIYGKVMACSRCSLKMIQRMARQGRIKNRSRLGNNKVNKHRPLFSAGDILAAFRDRPYEQLVTHGKGYYRRST